MRILKWLLLVLLAVVGLTVMGVCWTLFTQGGRDWLVGQVNGVTRALATPVVLGRLEGNPLRDARLASLTVGDAQGIWLTVEGIRLVWKPLALLGVERPFDILDVAKIVVARLPVSTEEEPVADEDAPVDVLGYMRYVPVELRLADVQVDAPVTGRPHRLAAGIVSEGGIQQISVTTLEGPVTTVSGAVVVKAMDDVTVDVRGSEAARGLVGGLLKLPAGVGISATLTGAMQGEQVRLDVLDVQAGQTHVWGHGEGTRNGDVVSGSVVLAAKDLRELQGVSGVALRGKAHVRAVVDGGLGGLGVKLQVSDTTLAVSETRVTRMDADVSGTVNVRDAVLPFAVRGVVSGTLSGVGVGSYPFGLVADVSGTKDALGVQGKGQMRRGNERADVVVGAAVVVSPLAVNGTLDAVWVQGQNRFAGTVAGALDPVQARLQKLSLTGPGTLVSGSGVVHLQDYTVNGGAVVQVADLAALANLAGVDVQGKIDANVAARAANGVQTARADVKRFEVIYGGKRAVLRNSSRLDWDGKVGSLSPFVLEIAGGTVSAQGRMSEQMVAGTLVVEGLDISELVDSDDVGGKVDLWADIGGKPAVPVVSVDGKFDGKLGEIPLAVTAAGAWRGGQVALKMNAKSGELTAEADVSVQGRLSLIPFEVGVGPGSALRGRVTADVDLAVFNPLLWSSRQQVGGRVSGSVALGGTLGVPTADGRFVLVGGSYAQSTSGVCLKNVGAEIVANHDVVEVRDLQSADGEGGTLAGNARFGLQGSHALQAQVGLRRLKLFCGGLASGQVDGDVGMSGVLADHTVRGNVLVGPLNVRVPGASRQVDIPQVDVERVTTKEKVSLPVITRLDVVLDAPQKIFVRGRGLDAEFGGKLNVTGTASEPQLHGSLSALRGKYTLLDRTLDLADSRVRFEGAVPPSPYLAIKATTRAQGTDITLNVMGTAVKPQITLSSSPALPQDEVLALLLFGRQLANISAFEALKLAQATRVLAGLDSGEPTILDRARETLGLDTLDIGSGEEAGDVTVTTGKYLTDDVYLSVQQGAEPEDRLFKTEIELTPSVTGNTTVDGTGNQSIGVEWKRDY